MKTLHQRFIKPIFLVLTFLFSQPAYSNEVLEIEAEDADLSSSSLMQAYNSGSASGGQYIMVGNGDAFYCCSSKKAVFTFTITRPGTYKIKGRVKASYTSSDGDDDYLNNSFYVNVNGSGQYVWGLSLGDWHDDFVNQDNGGSDVVVTLAVGDAEVSVHRREDGTKLDKLTLVPIDVTDPTPSNSISDVPLSVSASVDPNVMLLIDTSGSMRNVIWEDNYDPNTTYDSWGFDATNGNIHRHSISTSDCSSGYQRGTRAGTSNKKCLKLPDPNGDNEGRYTGNYLNYLFSTKNNNSNLTNAIPSETRMQVARSVATKLVTDTSGIRFGTSEFYAKDSEDNAHGATISVGCGDNNTSALTTAIGNYSAGGNTPLAESLYEITRYFRGASSYYHSQTYTSPIQYRCQKNFVIAITDGFPTFDSNIPSNYAADTDGTSASLPNWDGLAPSTSWSSYPIFPQYSDGHKTNDNDEAKHLYFDDVAKFAYDIDLITSGTDMDSVSYEDPDFDQQNLETYTVGFSLGMQMLEDAAEYGHGAYYTASNSSQLTAALQAAVDDAKSQSNSTAAPATNNSFKLSSTSKKLQASYDSGEWTGDITAYVIDPDTGIPSVTASWVASNNLPSAATRKIVTYDATYNSNTGTGIEFQWPTDHNSPSSGTDLNSSMITSLLTDSDGSDDATYGSQLVAWLRGDTSTSTPFADDFRVRDSLIGDIVNSAPVFVGQKFLPFSKYSGDEGTRYTAFINTTEYTGRTGALYVGANDGMLHAFNVDTGRELFAFIPAAIFPNLSKLAASDYTDNHKYFVDGKMQAFPAYVNSAWKTVLVGTPGAGGRSVFALDVTTPQSFDKEGSDVMWEVTDPDLGYSLGEPSIVRLNDGKWYAAVANGYYSDNYTAMLLLIDLEDGSITKISTSNGSSSNPNGLSPPIPVDLDGNQTVDVIYAGDYRGNLWRFDLRSTLDTSWSADLLFTGTALSTGSEQHITVKPDVAAHPDGGVVVLFGTGKYFETDDATLPASPEVETFYAIRDDTTKIDSNDSVNTNRSRTDLEPQTVTGEAFDVAVGSETQDVRVISTNAVDYTSKSGWYLDLKLATGSAEGERVINTPHIRKGRIEFSTIIPEVTSACTSSGRSWLYSLDALTGSNPSTSSIFDLNGDGIIDDNDKVLVNGQLVYVSVVGDDEMIGEVGSTGNDKNDYVGSKPLLAVGGYNKGRQSWRRIR